MDEETEEETRMDLDEETEGEIRMDLDEETVEEAELNLDKQNVGKEIKMEFDEEIIEEIKAAGAPQSSAVRQRVAALILSKSEEEILSFLTKRSNGPNPWQAVLDLVKALFYGLAPLAKEDHSSISASILLSTFVNVINLVHAQGATTDKRLIDCVSVLIQEMETFPKVLLPSIAESVLSHLEIGINQDFVDPGEGHVQYLLEFFPRCLGLIGCAGTVTMPCEDGEKLQITGIQYKERMLKRILALCWSRKFVMKMAGLLRELPLEATEMEEFVRKLFSHMKDAEPQDLPSLVYQLLLLASKGFKRIVMTGLINFFNKLHVLENKRRKGLNHGQMTRHKASADAFRQMEGTIVLHINFAVKQDPTLGQEWLYLVRTNTWPLTPFLVSVLLSIGRIQRFEQASFDLLRTAALKCFKDCHQCRESRLAAAVLGAKCQQMAIHMEQSFMRTVQSSTFGWDHIIPSVVRMGFCLIESVGPGRPRVEEVWRPSDPMSSTHSSSTQELGILVLSAAFEVHEMARDEIIEQCKCRILALKPQHSAPIIRMIVRLVQNCPQLMLEHSNRLKECLDYFTFLHAISASSLVQAICPLFQLSRDLQDYTILVLRKAMFGREETARMTAVQGLLDLIIADKQARMNESDSARSLFNEASSSQISHQSDRRQSGRNANLLQDLLGLLRRCLSQQVSVRETLYRGLPKLLEVDPDSCEAIYDLIWPHFSRFYVPGPENTVSFELDSCVVVHNGTVRVIEPLDHLLSCIHQLLILAPPRGASLGFSGTTFGWSADEETTRISSGESLAMAFRTMRKTVTRSSVGDFYHDKTLDFSPDNPEAQKNLEQARLLLGVMEVLMDSAVSDCVNQESLVKRKEAEKELDSYLDLHDSLMQIMNQKQARTTGKSSGKKDNNSGSKGRKKSEPKDDSREPLKKSGGFLLPRTSVEQRNSFLRNASIVYLLESYASQLQTQASGGGRDRVNGCTSQSTLNPSRQPRTGASQREITEGKDSRVPIFTLQKCLGHLKAIQQRESSGVTRIQWHLLADPLFRVFRMLTSSNANATLATQDATKEKGKGGRGKKVDNESHDGLLLSSLKCLDELMRLAFRTGRVIEVIELMNVDDDGARAVDDLNSDEETSSPGEYKGDDFQGLEAKRVQRWLVKQACPLLEALLERSQYLEVEIFAGILQTLGCKLPQTLMRKHGTWAHLVCRRSEVRHVGAARSLINLAVCLNAPPEDLLVAQRFAAELSKVMESEDHDPVDQSDQYPTINAVTRVGIAGLLFQRAEMVLIDLEWLLPKIKSLSLSEPDGKATVSLGVSKRMEMEEMLHTRMESIVLLLSFFTTMTLSGTLAEQLLRSAMHLYKCFAAATRLLIAPKGFIQASPSTHFQRLAELTCKKLTAPVYNFMAVKHRDEQEQSKAKGSVSQIKREGRTIPNLIFHIEESERYLIQLSKVSKVNLLRAAKRSTARDFKILVDEEKKDKYSSAELNNEEPPEDQDPEDGSDEEAVAPEEEEEGDPVVPEEHEDEAEQDTAADNHKTSGTEDSVRPSRGPQRSRSRVIHDSDSDSEDDDTRRRKKQRSPEIV